MLRNKAFIFLFITVLLDCIGLRIIYPVSASLITSVSHAGIHDSITYNGWMLSIYAVMQFIFAPVVGGISDRYGRRPVLLVSLVGMGLSYLFLMWANTLPLLFIGRMIAGIMGSTLTTAFAYTADISKPENRAKLFGYLSAAIGIGFIVGPFIGGFFSQWGLRVPFFLSGILAFLNAIFGFFVLKESLSPENRRAFQIVRSNPITGIYFYLKKKNSTSYFIVLFCLFFSAQVLPVIWPFYTKLVWNWSDLTIGYSMTVVGLMISLVKIGVINWSQNLLGTHKTILAGLIFTTLGFVFFGINQSLVFLFLAGFIYALGGIASPTLQAHISTQTTASDQGELQGIISSILNLVNIVAPLLVSQLFFFTSSKNLFFHPGTSFIFGAFISGIGMFFMLRIIKNETK